MAEPKSDGVSSLSADCSLDCQSHCLIDCSQGHYYTAGNCLECPAGSYCPGGRAAPRKCPQGTANELTAQGNLSACQPCPPGQQPNPSRSLCVTCTPLSAEDSRPCQPCPAGQFCPDGLEVPPCPAGSFKPKDGVPRASNNSLLLPGLCPKILILGWLRSPSRSWLVFEVPCWVFLPCWSQIPSALPARDTQPCARTGRGCRLQILPSREGLHPAWPGPARLTVLSRVLFSAVLSLRYVCPTGSASPHAPSNACPPGTVGNHLDLFDKSQCEPCPAGFVCARGTGGQQKPPSPCPVGHYCPPGTKPPAQLRCAPGTWSNRSRLASAQECSPCPRGWFCVPGAREPTGRCSSGHYCPQGSWRSTQSPCPAGTHSSRLGRGSVEDCSACPAGAFCPPGTSKPVLCPLGSFRSGPGAEVAADCTPCPGGHHCPELGTVTPRACGAGNFSEPGSASCSPCRVGHFCASENTSLEVMLLAMVCPAGLLCPGGQAAVPSATANACPQGHFCPQGAAAQPCPNGTYGEQRGLSSAAGCSPCPAGKFCYTDGTEPPGIPHPTGDCPAGYLCPPGTGFPFSFPCQPGSFWDNSSTGGEGVCKPCPAGHFCDSPALTQPKPCPAGFYCAEGSSKPEPCPEGTFGDRQGLAGPSGCSPCARGSYCAGPGLSGPSGLCEAGFYCQGRALTPWPTDGVTGAVCPAGSYCPPGSAFPIPCPPGTFSNISGLRSLQECLDCPPGLYCDGTNNQAPSGLCEPGYFCTGGAKSALQYVVMEGHYSSAGAFKPEPCPLGTFQPKKSQKPLGEDMSSISPGLCLHLTWQFLLSFLAQYKFGRAAESLAWQGAVLSLFVGTALRGLSAVSQAWLPPGIVPKAISAWLAAPCLSRAWREVSQLWRGQDPASPALQGCSAAGQGCLSRRGTASLAITALKAPAPPHPWGFPLEISAHEDIIAQLAQGTPKRCHVLLAPGMAREEPRMSPGACPVPLAISAACLARMLLGGFVHKAITARGRPGLQRQRMASLETSVPGDISALQAQQLLPPAPAGNTAMPQVRGCRNSTGQELQKCDRSGAAEMQQSGDAEMRQVRRCRNATGQDKCLPCPAGFHCSKGLQHRCPPGFYCPPKTGITFYSCPPGTYNPSYGLSQAERCQQCPAGMFCGEWGLSSPSGPCWPGFFCTTGASVPNPSGATNTSSGGPCPPGHFCPAGTSIPQPCPVGTYSDRLHNGQDSSCTQCPAGHFCASPGLTAPSGPCSPGYFCQPGASSPSPLGEQGW
ncbi:hypothetical protein Nmel_017354, partial [Mimus melanotis]